MIRAVLDTNVLASGFTIPGTPPDLLIRLWLAGAFILVYSDVIVSELASTLLKPYFRARLTQDQRSDDLGLLFSFGERTSASVSIEGVATHAEDDLVLATAVSGRAEYLVTGDRRFIERVGTYRGVQLISPRLPGTARTARLSRALTSFAHGDEQKVAQVRDRGPNAAVGDRPSRCSEAQRRAKGPRDASPGESIAGFS